MNSNRTPLDVEDDVTVLYLLFLHFKSNKPLICIFILSYRLF